MPTTFSTSGGSVKKWFEPRGQDCRNLLNHHSFPGCPGNGMPLKLFMVVDSEQRMAQTAVTNIDFGGLYESFFQIGGKWRKPPDDKSVAKDGFFNSYS